MSGKWTDISTKDEEQYELLTATARGVIVRARTADLATPFSVYVEESTVRNTMRIGVSLI